jgi:metal-responsive CopG/Arc/MetJ family transcriptional regulator
MKKTISITIASDILSEVNKVAGLRGRSAFIESVLQRYLANERRARLDEIERLNRFADSFNQEMEDVLKYQCDPFEEK